VSARPLHRWAWLATVIALVLWLHQGLLAQFGQAGLDARSPPAAALPMRVRSLVAALPPAAPPPPMRAPRAAVAKVAAGAAPMPERVDPVDRSTPGQASAASAAVAPPAADATPVVEPSLFELPVYATRLPPPGRWRYRMRRGNATGEAELHWALQDDAGYELRLEGRVDGVTQLEWASRGGIDAAGLAPLRFALRRRGRDAQAANFQREAGKITFSGPTHEVPLPAGAQDRLSWMVQLPAVVDAAPERFGSGALIELFVVGARGDAAVWTFVVQGRETVAQMSALKVVREPRQLYDTRAEVWLDPGDHHLVLRAVLTQAGGRAVLELQRENEAP
jgi:hypothetical protein